MGSFMHLLWDGQVGLAPGPLIDRVLLKQAHVACTGAARDEAMIQEIADALAISVSSLGPMQEDIVSCGQGSRDLCKEWPCAVACVF